MIFGLNPSQDVKDVPGFLQAMGIANTMATFVFSSAMTKVSATNSRRWATRAIMLSWLSMAVAGSNYVIDLKIFGFGLVLLDFGLMMWLCSFFIMSWTIGGIANKAVNTGVSLRKERRVEFESRFDEPDFGVPLVDDAIRHARSFGTHIHYPFLLIHDKDSPGLQIVRQFVAAGIKAGDAVIYFSFSRPAKTIIEQLKSHGLCSDIRGSKVYIVDCYSCAYMPEELPRPFRRQENVFYADPFNPADVYRKYSDALREAGRKTRFCRAVYETLSDFLKIADSELVMHYLRRTVVYEEMKGIKSLYVFWSGALEGASENYVPWFFNTTLRITSLVRSADALALKYQFKLERIFPDPVCIKTDDTFVADLVPLFEENRVRIAAFAGLLANLRYKPKPYDFLPRFRTSADYAKHVANFAFFMVAIDHKTHTDAVRYEDTVSGTFYHGSDLLYKLAEEAKSKDQGLFLAERMVAIEDDEVAAIFRTAGGVVPADLTGRAKIFRECANFLLERNENDVPIYKGDVQNLIAHAHGKIAGVNGLVELLHQTPAYADPIAKKANLFCKIVLREGLSPPTGRDQIDISVDHVLMTMALRSGMVTAGAGETSPAASLKAGSMLEEYTIAVLREVTRSAFHRAVRLSRCHADEVDDVVWSYGRECLRNVTPLLDPAAITSELDAQINLPAKAKFIEFMNGLDADAEPSWRDIPTVNFPFTEYF